MAKKSQVKVIWHGPELFVKLATHSASLLKLAIVFLRGEIQKTLTGDRSGRVYRVPGTQTFYTASAPGEAPASRTGTLRNAISFRVDKVNLTALVGPKIFNPPYPEFLEFGTKNASPRPFMRPTFEANKERVIAILKSGWRNIT